jgi:glycosyltransferase involved in cell wall biosynthesis
MTHLAERAERRGLVMSDFIFALSSYTFEALKGYGVAHKTCLAPCGVETNVFQPGARDQDYIICVARLFDARKNVPLLLRAYALLCGRRKPCPRLFLVGESPTAEASRMLRDLGIAGQVEMIGPQPPIKLAELYRGAKLFVLSSDEEGLGIVILEAMASGLPVVSTACGGPNMLIADGENGFLTPVGDAEALAGALDRVLEDPAQAERMGHNARTAVERSYSKPAIGAIFLEQYEKIIAATAS